MLKFLVISIILFQLNCLKAKKSIFDFSNTNNPITSSIITSVVTSLTRPFVGTGTTITPAVAEAYAGNTNWMDYIRRNMFSPSSVAQTTITACDGTETGWYNSCIHAGEIRKFEMTNISDCIDVTATDSLGVFNWICVVQSGKVFVYSTGLKEEKGLSDLINFTSATWRNNSVEVKKASQIIATSPPSAWWTNPIAVNNSGGTLITAGIYIVTQDNANINFILNAPKIAVLVEPEKKIVYSSGTTITANAISNFYWLEGNFATSSATTISSSAKFFVIKNANLFSAATGSGLSIASSGNGYVQNLRAKAPGFSGINFSINMIINSLNSYGSIHGIVMTSGGSDNLIFNSTIFGNGFHGVSGAFTSRYFLQNSTIVNNSQNGTALSLSAGSWNNFSSINNFGLGIGSPPDNNYTNIVSASNLQQITTNPGNIAFNGILKTSNTACGTSSSGVNSNCAKIAPSVSHPSDTNSANISNSFVGKVSTDSKNSQSPTSGNPATDPFNFENKHRGWGNGGGTFPLGTNQGNCSSSCQIWDWSLRATDTVIRNALACPSGTVTDVHTWSNSTTVTYLRNAMEIFNDGVGNDNGICESNEDCIYTPNIASYQGHGNLVKANQTTSTTNVCNDIGAGGTITNVKLWKYETNGY